MSLSSIETQAQNLKENGYAIINPKIDRQVLSQWQTTFLDCIFRNSQFFNKDAEDGILGGFSAFATPDSFHHPFVRFLRLQAEEAMSDFFAAFMTLIGMADSNLQVLFDRAMYRKQGKLVTAESGHRDECVFAQEGDHIFGGWFNIDHTTQHFLCVPGTHVGSNKHSGFAPLTKAEAAYYNSKKQTIVVPSGSILIFYENMVHFVANTKAKTDSCRLFLGWRITNSAVPMDPDTEKYIQEQGVPKIKSGQVPPVYAKLHLVNHIEKLESFSKKNIRKELLVHHTVKSGKNLNKPPFLICKRFIPSLKELSEQFPDKFKMLPEYSQKEYRQMMPHKLGPCPDS